MTKLYEVIYWNENDKCKVRKTNLGTVNNGHTDATSNCRFKGTTVVWEILFNNVSQFYVKTKKEALAIRKWANDRFSDWDEKGDLERYWWNQPESHDFD